MDVIKLLLPTHPIRVHTGFSKGKITIKLIKFSLYLCVTTPFSPPAPLLHLASVPLAPQAHPIMYTTDRVYTHYDL